MLNYNSPIKEKKLYSGLSIEEMVDRVIDKLLSDRPDVLEMSIA